MTGCLLQVGYQEGGKYYVNNHLMFKILIHKTNGQYTRTRKNMAELEAAAIIEVAHLSQSACQSYSTFSWGLDAIMRSNSRPDNDRS